MQSSFGELMIRDARETDLTAIVAIYNATVPSRISAADTEPIDVSERVAWFAEHSSDRRPLWVAVDHEETVHGWLGLQNYDHRPSYASTAEISVFLRASARGQGLGGFLLSQALTIAPSLGISRLIAGVFGHNQPSRALFSSRGFEVWGSLQGVVQLDGIERDLVIYGRKV